LNVAGRRTEPPSVAMIFGGLLIGFVVLLATTLIALAAVLSKPALAPIAIAGGTMLAVTAAFGWLLLSRLARPLDRLALDIEIIARENPGHALGIGSNHWLHRLSAAVDVMRARLVNVEAQGAQALAEAWRQGADQKRWLEAILHDLTEGIVVCNLQHQVLLYNQAAADLLGGTHAFGLGRSLFPSLTREPVLHALERQTQRLESGWAGAGTRFMCGAAEGQRLIAARLGVVLDAAGAPNGYVLSLSEFGEEHAALAKRDDLLELATEGLRAPIANLRAAAEMLTQSLKLSEAERGAFQEVVLSESMALSNQLDALGRGYRELGGGRWMMAEIYSSDLIASLNRRMVGSPLQLSATGLPCWLYGDSLSLLVLLEFLLRQLHAVTNVEAFDIALSRSDNKTYLDLVWGGSPVPAAQLETWLTRSLVGGLGPLTGRVVLRRHGSAANSACLGRGRPRARTSAQAAPPGVLRFRPSAPSRADGPLRRAAAQTAHLCGFRCGDHRSLAIGRRRGGLDRRRAHRERSYPHHRDIRASGESGPVYSRDLDSLPWGH
jgi:DNA polymerase III subunit epsilon